MLNYTGPKNDQGIRVYYNGGGLGNDKTKDTASLTSGDGRIVVGRHYTGRDQSYASVEIDELLFFNQYLSIEEIRKLNNAV